MPPAPEYDALLKAAIEQLHSLIIDDQWNGDYELLLQPFPEKDHERARQDLERVHGRIKRQPPPPASVLPEWLGDRFTLVNRLGRGGMANVFLVRDNDSGNNVALKVIHDGQHLGRFRQEASLLQEIDSSHIVKVHDWIESSNADSQGAAIVMDYVQGKDLGKMIRRREQPAEFAEVMTWMIGIGQAMIDANGQGITHRDIKPANILIRESDNVALLVDFGLATDRNPQVKHSLSGAVLGTISYMSPEQTYGSESADARSDIYGFGATFYHVCTGMPPYVSDDPFTTVHLIRNEPLASPVTHNRKIPSEIVDILERALAKQPRDRFQTFEELKSQLEVIMTSIESLDQEPLRAVEKRAGEGSVFDENALTTLIAAYEEAKSRRNDARQQQQLTRERQDTEYTEGSKQLEVRRKNADYDAEKLVRVKAAEVDKEIAAFEAMSSRHEQSVSFHELIITSVPRGLHPGKTGFCTVASTPEMPKQVSATLGRLAGYRHLFQPQGDKANLNPVAYSFLTGKIGRDEYRILARVADAGLDYSRRTNKLAHLLAVEQVPDIDAGPAWLASQPGFFQDSWSADPHWLPEPAQRKLPSGTLEAAPCQRWKMAMGDAGWAGLLAETIIDRSKKGAYLIYEPGMDLLPLILEAQALLTPAQRWQATFSTFYTKFPPSIDCFWRCVPEGIEEAAQARRSRDRLVIDLCKPSPVEETLVSEWVTAARTGQLPVVKSVAPPTLGLQRLADAGFPGDRFALPDRPDDPMRGAVYRAAEPLQWRYKERRWFGSLGFHPLAVVVFPVVLVGRCLAAVWRFLSRPWRKDLSLGAPMTPEPERDPEVPVARRRFANGKELQIVVGDIVEQGQACEVIVSSDDGLLRMNAGVSNRIKQAAGIQVHEEVQRFAPVQAGRVIVTSAGNLPQRMIFHGITLALPVSQMEGNYIPTTDLIRNILDSCCYHIESSQIKSIIFPLLGTGIAGMEAERCLETMIEYLVRELEEGITPLQEARIVIRPDIFEKLGPMIERLL